MALFRDFDFLIQWHLTERCNLRCRHCYQACRTGRELSSEEFRDVLSELGEMFSAWHDAQGVTISPSFNITGGEPLLRPDFFAALAKIAGRGYPQFVLTNGTLIDAGNATRMAELGVAGVQVSIEGPERINDSIRGRGSYAAALAGVEHLLNAALPVTLNMTLSKLNAHHLPKMVSLASNLGVQRLGITRLVPSGNAAGMSGEMLSRSELKRLYSELFALGRPGLKIVSSDPIAAQMMLQTGFDQGCTPYGGCAAGVSGLTILADGTIVPCRRLDIPLGNVRTDALREVWATSPILARLRDKSLYRGKCGACERWGGCRGCRAIAYACSVARGEPDFLSEDPQCFLESR